MLQIIGWLGCLYLVVKALEIIANPAYRDANGMMKSAAIWAALLAGFGAVGFALWLAAQGGAFPQQSSAERDSDELSASIINKVAVGGGNLKNQVIGLSAFYNIGQLFAK